MPVRSAGIALRGGNVFVVRSICVGFLVDKVAPIKFIAKFLHTHLSPTHYSLSYLQQRYITHLQACLSLVACSVAVMGRWQYGEDHFISFYGTTAPSWPGPSHYRAFTITLRHTTLGRTSLDE